MNNLQETKGCQVWVMLWDLILNEIMLFLILILEPSSSVTIVEKYDPNLFKLIEKKLDMLLTTV